MITVFAICPPVDFFIQMWFVCWTSKKRDMTYSKPCFINPKTPALVYLIGFSMFSSKNSEISDPFGSKLHSDQHHFTQNLALRRAGNDPPLKIQQKRHWKIRGGIRKAYFSLNSLPKVSSSCENLTKQLAFFLQLPIFNGVIFARISQKNHVRHLSCTKKNAVNTRYVND